MLAGHLGLFALLAVANALSSTSQTFCRCTSDQSCWPTAAEFQVLSSQVSQSLIYPVPPASPCYPPSNPSGNCTDVRMNFRNALWRADNPGALQETNQETLLIRSNRTLELCSIDTSLGYPCSQGSIPVVGVDARSAQDIQTAINFASTYNLRLVIKNTGHDFAGRNTGQGAFMIWTHNMKNITFHDKFTPVGSPASTAYDNAFTFEAGVQWYEAYAAAASHNRVLVGGISAGSTVGAAGGWMSGGGHSIISPTYGLGVDNVLEITVVTADGSHLTANDYVNSDLYWALRGGGGATYGVMTSVTYRSHPLTQFSGAFVTVIRDESDTTNPNATQNMLAELMRETSSLYDQHYGGYCLASRYSFVLMLYGINATWEQTNATFKPFFDYVWTQAQAGGLTISNYTAHYPDFSFHEGIFGSPVNSTLGNTEVSSRLLPKDVVTSDPDALSAQLMDLPNIAYFLVAGGAVASADPESTGLNPAWRRAHAHSYISHSWPDGTTFAEIEANRTLFKKNMAKLESVAPDSGCYLNEASPYEFNWKQSFFGSHYDELREIKAKYDPEDLFIVHEGVGSDEWDASLICRVDT